MMRGERKARGRKNKKVDGKKDVAILWV